MFYIQLKHMELNKQREMTNEMTNSLRSITNEFGKFNCHVLCGLLLVTYKLEILTAVCTANAIWD